MVVKIRFFAWLREKIGMNSIEMSYSGSLQGLLNELKRYLKKKADVIFEDSSLKGDVLISVNNKLIPIKKLKDFNVKDGDVIDIFPMGIGG